MVLSAYKCPTPPIPGIAMHATPATPAPANSSVQAPPLSATQPLAPPNINIDSNTYQDLVLGPTNRNTLSL